ncbi:unnamed protein product [Adineta ricciae]|uniref:Uncharacterized protein n=1 Tax=Adineta ricciae TaxID=249248 RepID=A0A814IVR7_ADIRI|nr:unnamed protein product [Adineta ricciae]
MGQLFNRISTVQTDQETTELIIQNSAKFIQPLIKKRKRLEQDSNSRKKRLYVYNDYSRLFNSSKFTRQSMMNNSLTSKIFFKCQLCCRCFPTKDSYLDHMIDCAIERQASIRIVRAKTN